VVDHARECLCRRRPSCCCEVLTILPLALPRARKSGGVAGIDVLERPPNRRRQCEGGDASEVIDSPAPHTHISDCPSGLGAAAEVACSLSSVLPSCCKRSMTSCRLDRVTRVAAMAMRGPLHKQLADPVSTSPLPRGVVLMGLVRLPATLLLPAMPVKEQSSWIRMTPCW
jgi:hypothetical protein